MTPRLKHLALVVLFCLFACLYACASSETPKPAPQAETDETVQTKADAEPPEIVAHKCLRVLLIKDPIILDQAARRMADGEDFITLAHSLVAGHPDKVSDRTICTGSGDLDPALAQAAQDLEPGQSAGPVILGQGGALVRATTDRWFLLGRAEMQAGNHHLAEEALQKDLELNPDHVSTWHLLGLSRMARGDWLRGLEALEMGLAWAPDNSALINDVGSALWELGRRKEALERYEQALALSPKNPLLMNNLAWALAEQGRDLERAEALVRKALDIAPDQAAFWDTLGQVMEAEKRPALAVIAYHHALALEAERPGTKRRMLAAVSGLSPDEVSRLAVGEDLAPARLSQVDKAFESKVVRPAPLLPPPRVKTAPAPSPPPAVKRFLDTSVGQADASAHDLKVPAKAQTAKPEPKMAAAEPTVTAPPPVKEPPEPLPLLEGQPVLNAPDPQQKQEETAAAAGGQTKELKVEAAPGPEQIPEQEVQTERPRAAEEAASKPETESEPAAAAEPRAQAAGESTGEVAASTETSKYAADQAGPTPEPEVVDETAPHPQAGPESGAAESAWLKRWMGADRDWTPSGGQDQAKTAALPEQSESADTAQAQESAGPETASGVRVVLRQSAEEESGERIPGAESPTPATGEVKAVTETISPPTTANAENTPPPPPSTASGLAGWYVQTSSYRTLELAKKECNQWHDWGWGCQLGHLDMGDKGKWYRVMLGPYTSKGEARRVGRDLVKQGVIKEFLIQDKTGQ